jgi:hypothetical protein
VRVSDEAQQEAFTLFNMNLEADSGCPFLDDVANEGRTISRIRG